MIFSGTRQQQRKGLTGPCRSFSNLKRDGRRPRRQSTFRSRTMSRRFYSDGADRRRVVGARPTNNNISCSNIVLTSLCVTTTSIPKGRDQKPVLPTFVRLILRNEANKSFVMNNTYFVGCRKGEMNLASCLLNLRERSHKSFYY